MACPGSWLIAAMSAAVGIVIARGSTVDAHIARRAGHLHSPFDHLKKTLSDLQYRKAFMTNRLLSIGGFLMMPFLQHIYGEQHSGFTGRTPLVFMFTGLASIVLSRWWEKISDSFGKFRSL